MSQRDPYAYHGSEIAIVGFAGRFPGASDPEELWRNLCDGVESIVALSDEEMLADGVAAEEIHHPHYVKRAAPLAGIELFDAAFFGFTPREAELMDPQQRVFLEVAWQALEHAGYDPARVAEPIGVFAGGKMGTYLFNLSSNPELFETLDTVTLGLGNDIALLAMRTAYKLDTKGPAYFVQSACSTSLSALHLACQSLLIDECRMALAGAVAIDVPNRRGYVYQDSGILAEDGHVRAFDADARGTVFGSGAGVVVLKRLEDALADGDRIWAVVKGSATNNDGARKAAFTAPAVEGQADVILRALVSAEVAPETIGYLEAHGTGTQLGDPVEIRAITKAWRAGTRKNGFCRLGTAKTHIGHLDAAAGVAGLIKTILSLDRGVLPPLLHFSAANPQIDFAATPFVPLQKLEAWPAVPGRPRRAAVSSFGFGGTNGHVILEEAPATAPSGPGRAAELLVVSAKSEKSLDAGARALAAHLRGTAQDNLADVAFTLLAGRAAMPHRLVVVAHDGAEAAALLDGERDGALRQHCEAAQRPVAFLFSGQGAQYAGMARDLYRTEPDFKATVDHCAELLLPLLGLDLRPLVFAADAERAAAGEALAATELAQPALFCIEYALARLLEQWGVRPAAMLGHSLGEYVAATLAGVFRLEDALRLVAIRGQLMARMPRGTMLTVSLSQPELAAILPAELDLAAVNGARRVVVSGPEPAIAAFEAELSAREVAHRRLHTSHAFHSAMMDGMLAQFRAELAKISCGAPQIPFVSNVTGAFLTAAEAQSPDYWTAHLRSTVLFAAGLETLRQEADFAYLEVGPGNTLASLAKSELGATAPIFQTLPHPNDQRGELETLLLAAGRLFLAGVALDPAGFFEGQRRRRIPLPTYQFDRRRFWIAPGQGGQGKRSGRKIHQIDAWFHLPSFHRSLPLEQAELPPGLYLILPDRGGTLAAALAAGIRAQGQQAVVAPAELDRLDPAAYARLLDGLGEPVRGIFHLGNLDEVEEQGVAGFFAAQAQGSYSLLHLGQALARPRPGGGAPAEVLLLIATRHLFDLSGEEEIRPEKAPLAGAAIVIGQEQGQIGCRVVDLGQGEAASLAEILLREGADSALARSRDVFVAWRGKKRHLLAYERTPIATPSQSPLREGGVYAITGGLGAVARLVALELARRARARLVLIGRSPLPPRPDWPAYLAEHPETDRTSRKLRQILELEAAGAEVLPFSGDATNEADLRAAFAAADARFGRLDGVIHMAGALEGDSIYRTFTEISREAAEEQFLPKGQALYALEAALAERPIDFCLLFSSNASVLGGLGFFAYAAANAFLDAFAASRSRKTGRLWISASWDEWPAQAISGPEIVTSMSELAMTAAEGTEALVRVLARGEGGHVVVSTGDLAARLDIWVRRDRHNAGKKAEVHARPELKTAYEAPASELEAKIAEIWQELLGIETVGMADNFFDLGGHSLLATQLMSRLRGVAGVEVPLQKLFEAPTVRGVATATSQLMGGAALPTAQAQAVAEAAAEIPVLPRPLPPQPLSPAQERMYFLHQLDRESAIYNLLTAVRLEGEVNDDLLEGAFRALLERHESLRTTFEMVGQEPRQVIHQQIRAEIIRVDLRAAADPEADWQQRTAELAGRPFDLEKGPLVRFALARLGPRQVVFVLVLHHVVSDGWSMSVLVRELTALYQAAVQGKEAPLPPLRLQYPDVAAWQRQRLSGAGLEQQLRFWRELLGGELEPLSLPTDTPRSRVRSFRGGWAAIDLPEALGRAVRELGREKRSTPFMILLAAFGALLHRYTGKTDLTIGTPIANRNHRDLEGVLGFLLNTLVLRLRVDGESSFGELVEATQEMALAAFAHQDLPLEVLVRELGLESAAADRGQALFQMMFLYQNVPPPKLELPDVQLSPYSSEAEMELGHAVFDWSLVVDEVGDSLRFSITYNQLLFRAATIERALAHLESLLAAALAEPARKIAELPLVDAATAAAEAALWSSAAAFDEAPVVQRIAALAAADPAAPALVFPGGEWSRGQLDQFSSRLAHYLIALGAAPEVRVGLLLERSPELIGAMLAVGKSGAAYLPLDPAQPAERSAGLLADAGARLLISSGELAAALPPLPGCRRVLLDAEAAHIAALPATPPDRPLLAEAAAYLIFTSGSTGKSKGVVVPQRALANFVSAASLAYPIQSDDRVLQFASLAFDTSAEEIYPVLAAGGALALRSEEMIAFPAVLLDRCREWGITVLDLPTAFWHELVASLASSGRRLGPPLRLLILGGERPLPERLAEFANLIEPGLRLLNTYGPTETTVVATWADLSAGLAAAQPDEEAPIGLPLANVRALLLDRYGRPQPPGLAGELVIGGAGLARGYLGQPALTADKFRPDPWSPEPGARLYRSGDLARRRPDGQLEFLGRIDFQVKIHGYRVEPGEIEAVLAEYPGLAEVAVLALGEAPRLELHAFASAAPGAAPVTGLELRRFLAERLPGHLVPAACHLLDKMPKNVSGKIDRKALIQLAGETPGPQREGRTFVAPRNDAEEVVCAVLAEVLGLPEVSVTDSFFELGGHSLLLMQVLHQLQDAFEVQIPLRRLYADPTPEGIAALIESLIIEQISAEEEP